MSFGSLVYHSVLQNMCDLEDADSHGRLNARQVTEGLHGDVVDGGEQT